MTDLRVSLPSLPDPTERNTLPGRSPTGMPPITVEAPPPATPFTAIRIGFVLARDKLLGPRARFTALLALALVASAAWIERRVTSAGAVDRALAATFSLVVPLAAFALAAEATGRARLDEAAWPLSRYGLARRDVALGTIAAAALASAALSALLAIVAVLLAGGSTAGDALTSSWIAALTAAAYTSWFSLGATFGRRGGGRFLPLLADFAIGGTSGVAGALLPRANAASLLGGTAPLHMPQASSSVILALSALVIGGVAALRCRE